MFDYKQPHVATQVGEEGVQLAFNFCEGYKSFLNQAKTEREAVNYALKAAQQAGYVPYQWGQALKAGDKVYYVNRSKSLILAQIGQQPIADGVRIMAAHIDSPRLDLKQNPLYERSDMAYFKTHYYGGIKKYQWVAMPLALHGVVVLADGSTQTICIGEDEADPLFYITDLLPHLAQDQMKRAATDIIKGEELNVVVGSLLSKPEESKEQGSAKQYILQLLHDKYGLVEKDFRSAELEVVPAMKARDVGFDRSLVGSYGHDDRVCAYPALQAMLALSQPKQTTLLVLTDKEEIGSMGCTGLQSAYLSYFIEDLSETLGAKARVVLSHSKCLSADVNSAYDATFGEVFEPENASYINRGVVITKFTGARGKSGSSDANAEFIAEIHHLLDDCQVVWQTGELGRVDLGGGGTVAAYVANLNMDVVDVGVPVLSMHAPYELVSKLDVYMTYKAFEAFVSKY